MKPENRYGCKIGIIKQFTECEGLTANDRLYYIQSYLLGWTNEETLKRLIKLYGSAKPENSGIEITTAIDKTIDCYGGDQVFIPAGTVGVLINVIIEDGKVMFLLDTDYGCEWFSSTEVEEKC